MYSKDLKNVNCTHIVNSDYCGNKYYGKWCCKSCTIAIGSKLMEKQPTGNSIRLGSFFVKHINRNTSIGLVLVNDR